MPGNRKGAGVFSCGRITYQAGLTVEGSQGPECENFECQGPRGLDLVQRSVGGANGFQREVLPDARNCAEFWGYGH